MKGQLGAYLGQPVAIYRSIYNVVEASPLFGNKIAFSWVDPDGTRRDKKGGTDFGKWLLNGKPTKWVTY